LPELLSLLLSSSQRVHAEEEAAALAELGEELKVSRHRVRQLQREAEQILKASMGRELISDVC